MAEGPLITLGSLLESKANAVLQALRKNIEGDDSIATRKLIQSIRTEVKIFGQAYIWELRMEDYWKNVEDGRKAGAPMPPIGPIMKWITQKGIPIGKLSKPRKQLLKALSNKKVKKAFAKRSREDMHRSLAFAIAKNISKRGIKPTHFYSEVINEDFKEKLKNEISKALKKDYTIQIIEASKNINLN